jgi:hypothetical protein
MDEKHILTLCKCGKPGTDEPHECPYQAEINDCRDDVCNCCENCAHECAMDI